ncbi:MAG: NrdJb [Candidatus Competibacterales bacterium]
MAKRIPGKIIGYSVGGPNVDPKPKADVVQIHESLERPPVLMGATYKIKTPLSEHALYITINDMVLNPGTEHELRRPFEVFINSKNMDHFQWIVALTRIMSAVFRKGGDVAFLVEELHSVFDPRGGYFKRGGQYMPSLVAEIGDVIEHHLRLIGLLHDRDVDDAKRRQLEAQRRDLGALSATPQGSQGHP